MIETVDFHIHSCFSFDIIRTGAFPQVLVSAAEEKGLEAVFLTDHLEINGETEGIYAPFCFAERKRACVAAKRSANIPVIIGIELGQATQYPSFAETIVKEARFDFVLGSLHNIKGMPDFALIDYSDLAPDGYNGLWNDYLDEYLAMTKLKYIDSFAHLTYPLRYFAKNGFELDIRQSESKLIKILKSIIARKKALELNSSGFRQSLGESMPNEYVISLYSQLGGRLITTGSDAHTPSDIAADFDKLEELSKKYELKLLDWRKFI